MATCSAFTFDELTHTYRDADGIAVPSVTQIIKAAGLISFDGINPRVLAAKAQLGTLVHQSAELLDRGENLEDYDIPEVVWEYLNGYIAFKNDTGFESDLIEHGTIATVLGMRYGMRLDRRGEINGQPHVIELKCGASEHPAWGIQLAAYSMGLPKPLPLGHHLRAAVQLGAQFPRGYKIHSYTEQGDEQMFLAALAIAMWKSNNNLFINEDIPERLTA